MMYSAHRAQDDIWHITVEQFTVKVGLMSVTAPQEPSGCRTS